MKYQKTLLITSLLIFLTPFLGFPSKVDVYIYVILGLLAVVISLLNIPPKENHSGSVFWEAKPESFFPSGEFFYINTDTLKKIEAGRARSIYSLQKKLLERKRIRGEIEAEDIGLVT